MGASENRRDARPWLETPGGKNAKRHRPDATTDGDLMRDARPGSQRNKRLECLAGNELHHNTSRMMADGGWTELDGC